MLSAALLLIPVVMAQKPQGDTLKGGEFFAEIRKESSDWTGMLVVDKKKARVNRLTLTLYKYCEMCQIPAVRLKFDFENDFQLCDVPNPKPELGNSMGSSRPVLAATQLEVKEKIDDGEQDIWPFEDLVIRECLRTVKADGSRHYSCTVIYIHPGGRRPPGSGNQVLPGPRGKLDLYVSSNGVKGTLIGKGLAEIEFSLTPIKRAEEKSEK